MSVATWQTVQIVLAMSGMRVEDVLLNESMITSEEGDYVLGQCEVLSRIQRKWGTRQRGVVTVFLQGIDLGNGGVECILCHWTNFSKIQLGLECPCQHLMGWGEDVMAGKKSSGEILQLRFDSFSLAFGHHWQGGVGASGHRWKIWQLDLLFILILGCALWWCGPKICVMDMFKPEWALSILLTLIPVFETRLQDSRLHFWYLLQHNTHRHVFWLKKLVWVFLEKSPGNRGLFVVCSMTWAWDERSEKSWDVKSGLTIGEGEEGPDNLLDVWERTILNRGEDGQSIRMAMEWPWHAFVCWTRFGGNIKGLILLSCWCSWNNFKNKKARVVDRLTVRLCKKFIPLLPNLLSNLVEYWKKGWMAGMCTLCLQPENAISAKWSLLRVKKTPDLALTISPCSFLYPITIKIWIPICCWACVKNFSARQPKRLCAFLNSEEQWIFEVQMPNETYLALVFASGPSAFQVCASCWYWFFSSSVRFCSTWLQAAW